LKHPKYLKELLEGSITVSELNESTIRDILKYLVKVHGQGLRQQDVRFQADYTSLHRLKVNTKNTEPSVYLDKNNS